MERDYARHAVRLLKREPSKGFKKLQRNDSDIVHIATELALDLQKGNIPDWYALLEKDLVSSEQILQKTNESSLQLSQPEQTLNRQDNNATEGVTKISSSSDEDTSKIDQSESKHSKWTTNKRNRNKVLSVEIFTRSARNPIASPTEQQRRPLSVVTAPRSYLPPALKLPLINENLRPLSTLSKRQNNLPSTTSRRRSETIFSPKEKDRKEVNCKRKRKKCFEDKPSLEMENPNILYEYWEIPFDPLRELVFTDRKIFKMEKAEFEDVEDISLKKKEVLANADYWEIRKIMHFVRIGNPTATVLALCALKELDLQKPSSKEIIRHFRGIALLLNILDTDNCRCRVAALKVLVRLANSPKTSDIIVKRNGIRQLVSILREEEKIVVSLACDVLSLLAKHSNARVIANKMNIVEKLMLVFKACIKKPLQEDNMKLLRSVCQALWSCCLLVRESDATMISESLDVISHLVETQDERLVVPLLGIVEECASVEYFRGKLEKESFIEKVISKIESTERIQVLSVKILFKCVSDGRSQKTLTKPNNLHEIMKMFKQNREGTNEELLTLLLGIIWRCSLNREHRKKFENHGIFSHVLNILKSSKNIQVKNAALGVLSEFLWDEAYTDSIHSHEVINLLIDHISITESAILVNSARSLGVCARNKAWRKTILQFDGLRLLWSLLKSSDEEVMASGAVALASVCADPEESANAVRSIVGGIELLMTLLANTELTKYKILTCLCEAAVSIAKDTENRSILTDYDLIQVLFRLSKSKSKMLRYYVTCLISRCCESAKERGRLSQCIPYLIEGLGDEFDDHVHCASICALNKLSHDLANCVLLRKDGTAKVLMSLLASSNERIQDAAADCLANVRKSITQVSVG